MLSRPAVLQRLGGSGGGVSWCCSHGTFVQRVRGRPMAERRGGRACLGDEPALGELGKPVGGGDPADDLEVERLARRRRRRGSASIASPEKLGRAHQHRGVVDRFLGPSLVGRLGDRYEDRSAAGGARGSRRATAEGGASPKTPAIGSPQAQRQRGEA